MFTQVAYAMSGSGEGGGGGMGAFAPLIIMFIIFYFLLIRPQQKKSKARREMLSSLRKGDKVVTNGGLYGDVTGLTDTVVTLEIAPRIRVKVARSMVSGLTGPAPQAPTPEPIEPK